MTPRKMSWMPPSSNTVTSVVVCPWMAPPKRRNTAETEYRRDQDAQQAEPREREAQHRGQLQRREAEARNGVEREANHPGERILGRAGEALLPVVAHRLLPEADPGREPAHEAVALWHGHEGVHHPPVQQPEIARVRGDVDRGQAADGAVEHGGGEQLEARLAGTFSPLRVDHLGALTPPRDEVGDDLGRVLQVGVDDDHGVAAGVVQAGGDGDLVAEVAREVDHAHARVTRGSRAGRAHMTPYEPSREPSLTRTSSNGSPSPSITPTMRS